MMNKRKRKPTRFERLSQELDRYTKVIKDKDHHIYKTPLPKGYLKVNNDYYNTQQIKYLSLCDVGLCIKHETKGYLKIPIKTIKSLSHVQEKG